MGNGVWFVALLGQEQPNTSRQRYEPYESKIKERGKRSAGRQSRVLRGITVPRDAPRTQRRKMACTPSHKPRGYAVWRVLASPSQSRKRYASSGRNAEKTEWLSDLSGERLQTEVSLFIFPRSLLGSDGSCPGSVGSQLVSTFEFKRLVTASQTVIWFASPRWLLRAVTFFGNFDLQTAGLAGPNLIQFQISAA